MVIASAGYKLSVEVTHKCEYYLLRLVIFVLAFCIARKAFVLTSLGLVSPGMGKNCFSCSVRGFAGLLVFVIFTSFVVLFISVRVFQELLHIP